MRFIIAILVGKATAYFTKLFKIGGGTSAPGLIALKIYPELIQKLSQGIGTNVVITGTNGKTTTAKMLAHFAKTAGLKVIGNHTGSNLERGIASALIANYKLQTTNYHLDLGIWELDEAAFNIALPKLKPKIVIFLNVFRDQLDRYGEIDSVLANWRQTLKSLPSDTQVLVNGDDVNTLKLAKAFAGRPACRRGRVQKFGVKDYKLIGESIEHLSEKENLDFEACDIKLQGLKNSSFSLLINHKSLFINLPLPGIYHIYDFLAAFAAGIKLSFKPEQMILSLKDYSPAFGRVEKLPFGYIFLIKNPAGATQVFETIAPNIKPADRLLLALNDNIADGTDVSWIWDVDFELFQNPSRAKPRQRRAKSRDYTIIASGTRSYDLAVRLKYAGFPTDTLTIQPDLEQALKEGRKNLTGNLFILPTYTAMLKLQSILAKSGIKKHYWKEEF